jgi:hypothetical protein
MTEISNTHTFVNVCRKQLHAKIVRECSHIFNNSWGNGGTHSNKSGPAESLLYSAKKLTSYASLHRQLELLCFSFWYLCYLPVTVAAQSTAWNIFARSNTGIVGSNTIRGMDVCARLFCV